MKCLKAILVLVTALVGMSTAQENVHFLTVLSYQWTTTHNVLTFTWPGHANTSCNSSTYVNGDIDMRGNVSNSGYVSMSGSVSGTETSSSTCSTTYTPPTTQNIDIQRPVVYILADNESSRMVLTCTRNVRWSQCIALEPGVFEARNQNGHFEVSVTKKGKPEWVKFDIIQQTAFSEQEQQEQSDAMGRKIETALHKSGKLQATSICPDTSAFTATITTFFKTHPDVFAASATSQRGTAPGRELRQYIDAHNLDPCIGASWNEAYDALKPTGAFALR